jgi:hypothetical protein
MQPLVQGRDPIVPRLWLMAAVFCAIGAARALRAIAIAPGPDLPELLFLAILGQAAGALLAGVGLMAGGRGAALGLALFAGSALLQMGADVFLYEVRALLEGLAIAVLAIGLAVFGWLALERERVPRATFRRLEI